MRQPGSAWSSDPRKKMTHPIFIFNYSDILSYGIKLNPKLESIIRCVEITRQILDECY